MTHVYVIVDYTDPKHIREVKPLGEFQKEGEARGALHNWKQTMKGNGRLYKVKAKRK